MKFEAESKKVHQGDFLELRWEADMPDVLFIVTDNGIEQRSMQVADSGSTRVYIGECKGRYTFSLKARKHGKEEVKVITVKVSGAIKPEKVKPAGVSRFQLWCEKRKAGWITFWNRLKYSWAVIPKKRKRLIVALWAVTALLLIWSILSGGHNPSAAHTTPATLV